MYKRQKQYCKKCGIGFLSTPFDLHSIDFLDELGVDFWKIPSGEVTNYPYLAKIGKTKKKIVMSTGMCEMSEIQDAIEVLEENGANDITILHCNTEYPTPFEDVNLSAMAQMKNELKKPVGYSDHTKGCLLYTSHIGNKVCFADLIFLFYRRKIICIRR